MATDRKIKNITLSLPDMKALVDVHKKGIVTTETLLVAQAATLNRLASGGLLEKPKNGRKAGFQWVAAKAEEFGSAVNIEALKEFAPSLFVTVSNESGDGGDGTPAGDAGNDGADGDTLPAE
jgi:hypothetical protein